MTQTASGTYVPTSKMTYEEFLATIPDDVHAEWEDGEVTYLTVEADNNLLQMFLGALIGFYNDLRLAGSLFSEPFVMKVGPKLPGRSPDLFFVRAENRDRVRKVHLEGPADLVIEIISPDSASRDRVKKYREYEVGGVGEYWLIDLEHKRADFYHLAENGRFVRVPALDGIYHSRELAGFWIKIEWLWQSPLPPVPAILKEMGLI